MTRRRCTTVALLAAGLLVLAGGLALRINDVHLQVVLTGSMQPAVSAGDVALTVPVPVEQLAVGDVIAFFPPGASSPVLHRITTLTTEAAGIVVTTRGDANRVADAWRATLVGTTGFRLIGVVPFVGWLTQIRGPILILAGLLVGLAFLRGQRRREVAIDSPIAA